MQNGGDPEQDYFVDGVTESLTTDLSRIRGSFVIGRNTASLTMARPSICRIDRLDVDAHALAGPLNAALEDTANVQLASDLAGAPKG